MRLGIGLLCSVFFSISCHAFNLRNQVDTYKQRYGLSDVDTKLTNNTGDGYDALYGTRNFRTVLHGIYYRGGANNKFHRDNKRSNMNPLPTDGLNNLCQEGFSEAMYLYEENFASAPKLMSCATSSQPNKLDYVQVDGLTKGNEHQLLTKIWQHIKGVKPGPIYAHCWNGWHAWGYVAAISLQQFCGWTQGEARAYWVTNTDGNSKGYEHVEKRVLAFQPFNDLKITMEEQALICPQR